MYCVPAPAAPPRPHRASQASSPNQLDPAIALIALRMATLRVSGVSASKNASSRVDATSMLTLTFPSLPRDSDHRAALGNLTRLRRLRLKKRFLPRCGHFNAEFPRCHSATLAPADLARRLVHLAIQRMPVNRRRARVQPHARRTPRL